LGLRSNRGTFAQNLAQISGIISQHLAVAPYMTDAVIPLSPSRLKELYFSLYNQNVIVSKQ
jgi:hypothetical protein